MGRHGDTQRMHCVHIAQTETTSRDIPSRLGRGGGVGRSFSPNDDTRRELLDCGLDDTIKSDITTGKSSTIGAESAKATEEEKRQ
jgi:hypothetical protein